MQGCVTHESCPLDMKFDSLYVMCRDGWEVDCGSRPCDDSSHCPSSPTTDSCIPPNQVDCADLGPGIFPDQENCRYCRCCSAAGSISSTAGTTGTAPTATPSLTTSSVGTTARGTP